MFYMVIYGLYSGEKKTVTLLRGRFIQDTKQQILPEWAKFYRRHDRNVLTYFLLEHAIGIIKERDFQVLQGSVETLFRWGGSRYNSVVTNILSDINTNNYGNRSIFTELFEK